MVIDNVIISGRNMQIGESLTFYVQTRMSELSNRYFGRIITCRIVFTKNPKRLFECHISAVIGQNLHYDGNATAHASVYGCFIESYNHLAKQLRRQKRYLHDDKPNGHAKERVLNELATPEFINGNISHLDIDGEDLSILDGNNPATEIEEIYGVFSP